MKYGYNLQEIDPPLSEEHKENAEKEFIILNYIYKIASVETHNVKSRTIALILL